MASVIGAGYSTWFFGETTTSDSSNDSIKFVVEGYTDMGVLEIAEETNATLTLDQRTGDYDDGNVAVAGNSNGNSSSGTVLIVPSSI